MTKLGTLADECICQPDDDVIGFVSQGDECWNHWLSRKGLVFAEAYFEGRLKIAFVFAGSDVAPVCSARSPVASKGVSEYSALRNSCLDTGIPFERRNHSGQFKGRHTSSGGNRDDELVLVCDVEGMKTTQPDIPAYVRFERLDFSDNLFSGELCFSTLHGAYKAVLPFGERKLDVFGLLRPMPDHAKDENIQRAAKIVNSISDGEGEPIWDGQLLFDEMGFLVGARIPFGHKAKGFLRQVNVDLPVKVIDVILCPSDLEQSGTGDTFFGMRHA